MKYGIFYGVGVGPGDPDLITLKAVKILQKADVIFTVKSRQSNRSVSGAIIDSIQDITAQCIELTFAMTPDVNDRESMINNNAEIILSELQQGKNCVFATIGDPLTYSTYGYLMKKIQNFNSEIKIKTVPGVNSWSALAAETNTVLVEDKETLTVVPSFSDNEPNIERNGTTVLLKPYRQRNTLLNNLKENNQSVLYGANLGLSNEFISKEFDSILSRPTEYLSMLIVKSNKK